MSTSSRNVFRSPLGAAFFLVAVVAFGVVLATALPSIELVGLRSGSTISTYVGGLGISLVLGSGGLLIGLALRRYVTQPEVRLATEGIQDMTIAGLCSTGGLLLAAWYVWSYVGPT